MTQQEFPVKAGARLMLQMASKGDAPTWQMGFDASGLLLSDDANMAQLPSNDLLSPLLRATLQQAPLDICYVSLRPGESALWRPVLPLRFECHEGQWRLSALDLNRQENQPFVEKKFVLARVMNVRPTHKKHYKVRPNTYKASTKTRVRIKLNPMLTVDQNTVVSRELGLDADGVLLINASDLFEFRRKYVDHSLSQTAPAREGVVWPLVVAIEEIA